MNYLVDISYDGSGYHGWAKQIDKKTIQGTIETCLANVYKKPIKTIGSGRTDTGVHALHQYFNFHEDVAKIEPQELIHILNRLFPTDIRINDIRIVDENFHAQHSAIEKTYQYVINTTPFSDAFANRYICNYGKPLDEQKLYEITNLFKGKHDFLSFSTSELENTVREIYDIQIHTTKDKTWIVITGNGFLRNMVRMIIGAIFDVCDYKKSKEDIINLLNSPKKGSANTIAPPNGLFLKDVKYDFNH